MISVFHGPVFSSRSAGDPPAGGNPNWILFTTDWRDIGIWIDTELWQD